MESAAGRYTCPLGVNRDRFSRFCLPVHVRFGLKATDWPIVGHLTSFYEYTP
jgi:hypothetical protein